MFDPAIKAPNASVVKDSGEKANVAFKDAYKGKAATADGKTETP